MIYTCMLLNLLFLKDVTTTTTTTAAASTTTAAETTATSTTTAEATTTLAPGVFDNCTASGAYFTATVSPNFDYLNSPNGDGGNYPRWYISAPENYSVEAYFDNQTYAIESNSYCYYDYAIFYDGNSTGDTMLNKFCGTNRPTSTYRSSDTQMLIVFSSDYTLEYAGFRIRIKAVPNTYPGCKADYQEYSVMYNREAVYNFNNYTYINNLSSPNFGVSNYPTNVEVFWLFTSYNTTHYKMVIDIISINIERSYGCIYDKLVLYDGPCIKDGVRDTVCGYWSKRWDLEGPEYLLHFHSDGYLTRDGFQLVYYAEEKAVTPPPTTTTTTFGPPVEAVIGAVKEMLGNYSTEDFPTRDLSAAIRTSVDFYLVGINGLDEVEQKMTSTGQFEVTWQDSSLVWDPTKRQGVVQVLLPQNDVWKPDIALMNGFTSITAMGAKFMFINVDYNGSCIWRPYQIMESVCKIDMTHYPYDRQICVLKFGTWSTDDSEVVTELGSLGLQIHPNFQENAEWRLITTETKQEDNNNHKVVEFFLTLERNHRYVTFYMTMPIVVLAYMNVFTFVIPSESGEKTGFSITIFLSFVVLLIINNDSMPENSDTISLYSAFVLTMTIFSAIALIVSVLQIRALTFTEKRYPIANRVKKIMKLIKRIQSVLTCSRRKTEKHEGGGGDKPDTNKPTESNIEDGTIGSSAVLKQVSFMDDKEDSEGENDRFTLPIQREPSRTTFRSDKENTLFEANTFIRSATALSLAENPSRESKPERSVSPSREITLGRSVSPSREITLGRSVSPSREITLGRSVSPSRENKPERSISATKIVKFADEERKPEQDKTIGDDINKGASDENTVGAGATNGAQSDLTLTRSVSNVDQSILPSNTGVSESISMTENKSVPHYDDNSQSSTDLYRVSPPNENINPVTKQDKHGQEINSVSTDNLAINPSVPLKDHLQVSNELQSDQNQSNEFTVTTNQAGTNIKSESASQGAKSSQLGSDENQSCSINGIVPHSVSKSIESSMNISVGNQSGSVADDVIQYQPTTATDIKMNRPSPTIENRPLSVKFASSESRVVLADHGRAIKVGKDRPISQSSGRPLSVFSQRSLSFVKQRPASSLKTEESTALLFGAEEMDKNSSDDDLEVKSDKSEDTVSKYSKSSESSESSCSNESEENDLSWSDLVSCADAVFFMIYIILTTIMTLAMFLTMIYAY